MEERLRVDWEWEGREWDFGVEVDGSDLRGMT